MEVVAQYHEADTDSYRPDYTKLPRYSREDLQQFTDVERLRTEVTNAIGWLNQEELEVIRSMIETMRPGSEVKDA